MESKTIVLLAIIVMFSFSALSGCIGDKDTAGIKKTPPADASCRDLLPRNVTGFTLVNVSDKWASLIGAEEGVGGDYAIDGNGSQAQITMEIYKVGNEGDIESVKEKIEGYISGKYIIFSSGLFLFVVEDIDWGGDINDMDVPEEMMQQLAEATGYYSP